MEKALTELMQNCNLKKRTELAGLFATFDVATLGDDMQEARIKEIYNQVLAENEFFAGDDYSRIGIEKGARIVDEKDDFTMSKDDFARYQTLTTAKLAEAGITDKNGYYLVSWSEQKVEARQKLIDFIIREIIPSSFREIFWRNRLNYTQMNKLIEISRPICKA